MKYITDWSKREFLALWEGWNMIQRSGRLDGQLIGYPPINAKIGQKEELPEYFHNYKDCIRLMQLLTPEQKVTFINSLREMLKPKKISDFDLITLGPNIWSTTIFGLLFKEQEGKEYDSRRTSEA